MSSMRMGMRGMSVNAGWQLLAAPMDKRILLAAELARAFSSADAFCLASTSRIGNFSSVIKALA